MGHAISNLALGVGQSIFVPKGGGGACVFLSTPPPILFDQSLKRTKFEDKIVKSTQLSLVPVGLHDLQIFPHRTGYA